MKIKNRLLVGAFKFIQAAIPLSLAGCSELSYNLGKWKADSLLAKATTQKLCSDGRKSLQQATCNRAFCLGPLAIELTEDSEHSCEAASNQGSKKQRTLSSFIEPPSPVIQIPASPDVRYVIGGRGEGLSCSIPSILEILFFSPQQFDTPGSTPTSPLSLQFAQACYAHDMCYRHGAATYGYQKEDCDDLLFDQAYRLCTSIYRANNINPTHKNPIDVCKAQAGSVYAGVNWFGSSSFLPLEKSTFFEFDAMARGKRAPFRVSRLATNLEGSAEPQLAHYIFDQDKVQLQIEGNQPKPLTGLSEARLAQLPAPRPMTDADNGGPSTAPYFTVQRDVLRNTGARIMVIPRNGTEVTELPPKPKSKNDIETFDCNSAVHLPTIEFNSITIYTFGISSQEPDTPNCPSTIKADPFRLTLKPIRFDKLAGTSYYRLQQLEPMIGKFGDNTESQILLLGRGWIYARDSNPTEDERKQASSGEGYKEQATVYRLSRNGTLSAAETAPIPEAALPVSPFRLNSSSRDGLLSVQTTETGHVNLTHWSRDNNANPSKWTTEHTQRLPELSSSWVEMPVQVVKNGDFEILVFTRILTNKNKANGPNDSYNVTIQAQAYSMNHQDKWVRVSCTQRAVAIPLQQQGTPRYDIDNLRTAWRRSQAIPFKSRDNGLDVIFIPHPLEQLAQRLELKIDEQGIERCKIQDT